MSKIKNIVSASVLFLLSGCYSVTSNSKPIIEPPVRIGTWSQFFADRIQNERVGLFAQLAGKVKDFPALSSLQFPDQLAFFVPSNTVLLAEFKSKSINIDTITSSEASNIVKRHAILNSDSDKGVAVSSFAGTKILMVREDAKCKYPNCDVLINGNPALQNSNQVIDGGPGYDHPNGTLYLLDTVL
jgi:hypothetical protein